MTPSRRAVLGSAGLLSLATAGSAGAAETAREADSADLQVILETYASFGIKASGGEGDVACGAWLQDELTRAGYVCRRQPFDIPFFEARQTTLVCGDARATVMPQAAVAPTGPQGLTAPLRLAAGRDSLTGAIAVVVLPFKRWTALAEAPVTRGLTDAIARGAAGVILVTTGPTGEAIGLNVSTKRPILKQPVAVLAPKDAVPFVEAAAAGKMATLTLDGLGGGAARRSAFNLIGRLDRKAAKTVVISTPRSGWFTCAGERGSGVAIWLELARWLARANHGVNIEMLATSGHEYEYIGGEHYLAEQAPKPDATRLWVHIGASAAARDWQELAQLMPLPSPDSQRVLTATADNLDQVRKAFKGVVGLEAAYLADRSIAGGEMVNVLAAGYPSTIGLYGSHRYFHTRDDDMRCVSGELVRPTAAAFQNAIQAVLRP